MPFEFESNHLSGVVLIKPRVFGDTRGFFMETYKASEFARNGVVEQFVQDNHSRSRQGVLRGLHYQLPPFAQAKLIQCIQGEIYDVVVDIRRSSDTFGQWSHVVLSAENKHILYVPVGFAHGFLTLSETAEIIYKVTAEYAPTYDRGILWNDPDLAIKWPESDYILSEKDRQNPTLTDAEVFA